MDSALPLPAPDGLPARSHYHLSRRELVQGIANRFVFSQMYIYLYLSMAILSLTTVVLSVREGCPGLAFYLLELVVNLAMILEVGVRLLAFGTHFWRSAFNWLDLAITIFCLITVAVMFGQGCRAKREEVLDTVLLVIRNGIQFSRLALMLRRSGKSIFSRIQPIDLEGAIHHSDASFFLDLDLDDEDEVIRRHHHARQSIPNRTEPAAVPFLHHDDELD